MKRNLFLTLILGVVLASCATLGEGGGSRTHVSDVKRNPSAFEGKTINLEGEVVSSLAVMGGLFQIYEAYSDDTLWIKVGEGQTLPKVRTFVKIRGSVDSGFKILNQNHGTVVEARAIEDITGR